MASRKRGATNLYNICCQNSCTAPVTESRLIEILNEFKASFKQELVADLIAALSDCAAATDQIPKVVDEKFDGMMEYKLKDFKRFNDSLPEEVVPKSCLYDNHDEILPEWTTKRSQIVPDVNRIYAKFGRQPSKFFTELVRIMYGDLLCNFKLEIHRLYEDPHRTTRKPLEKFDPTGFCIINDIIDHYYEKHADQIAENKERSHILHDDFRSLAIKVIDVWGNKAYCKRGRSKPNIDCLLLSYLKDGFKIKDDDSRESIKEVLSMYENLKYRPETIVKKKSKLSLTLRNVHCSKNSMVNSIFNNENDQD